MTNLTEKLKKGELPKNFYYVDVPEGSPIAYGNENYIEIETPEFGYLFYIEGEESKLPDYVKVLAPVPSYEEYKALQEENTKLKELLKECREPLEVLADKRNACDWCPEDLLAKINQVLGEE